jgi:hypothetical protein
MLDATPSACSMPPASYSPRTAPTLRWTRSHAAPASATPRSTDTSRPARTSSSPSMPRRSPRSRRSPTGSMGRTRCGSGSRRSSSWRRSETSRTRSRRAEHVRPFSTTGTPPCTRPRRHSSVAPRPQARSAPTSTPPTS